MSGGQLVVMDRSGRDVKRYPLASGLATLGSDPACDIRVLLPDVRPHHATVVVHAAQTVVRNVSYGDTFVNGRAVSVAALRHGDVITLGDRSLRWEYAQPAAGAARKLHISPPLTQTAGGRRGVRGAGGARRGGSAGGGAGGARRGGSAAGAAPARDRAVQLALEMRHRASMPGSTGGKQVAVVQPQRRDTNEQPDRAPAAGGHGPTKASLWIESRKPSPRRAAGAGGAGARGSLPAAAGGARATPLRLTVLRRAQSAKKHRIIKIEAPAEIDYTKRAAIMLMTGHTPKSKLGISPTTRKNVKSPSFVIKKHSPVRSSPAARATRTPARSSPAARATRTSARSSPAARATRTSARSSPAARATRTPVRSSPATRATRTPARGARASRASPRGSYRDSGNRSVTILEITDSTQNSTARSSDASTQNSTVRASDVSTRSRKSNKKSPTLPSPKKSAMKDHSKKSTRKTESIKFDLSNLGSRRDSPADTASGDDFTLHYSECGDPPSPRNSIGTSTPRSPARAGVESYSVVDLVSLDSNDAFKSLYDSADSSRSADFGTPDGARTRSGGARATRSVSGSAATTNKSTGSVGRPSTRRSKSLSTPENRVTSARSTRVSRASRSRSRLGDGELPPPDEDSSPRTSRRAGSAISLPGDATVTANDGDEGTITPEHRHSPVDVGTPVLSIQSLLDSSRGSAASALAGPAPPADYRRRTTGARAGTGSRQDLRSKSLSVRKTWLRLSRDSGASSDETDEGAPRPDDEETFTPRSAVKISPEAVKNKHSTAKKPQSKRSIIDDLDRSDVVKQLFSSPVKRKLSRSMTDFSRKQLFDEDAPRARHSRRTAARPPGSPPPAPARATNPAGTPDLGGVKRLFHKNTPENDLRDVRGVKRIFKRTSPANDLRNVSGVRRILRKSPRNDLTDVRGVRRVFRERREQRYHDVSGVEELFNESNLSVDRSEALFDALLGKPPIRAVYSKTFSAKTAKKPENRKGKSLHSSIDVITNNVEEWLERELGARLQRQPAARARAGSARGRAASHAYGAHTLPIKKRSLPEASAEKSKRRLPIKKRAVMHSTPVKGRDVTMNASELGRVSPIAPRDDTGSTLMLADDNQVKRAKTRTPRKQETPRKIDISKPTPEKLPEKQSPARRATRSNKHTDSSRTNTRRRRASIVIAKKTPLMSPKADVKTTSKTDSELVPIKVSPKKTRATRGKKEQKIETPKRTRVRAAKATVVVTKPSPKLKPQQRGRLAEKSPTKAQEITNRTRKTTVVETKPLSTKVSPKNNRRANAIAIEPKPRKTAIVKNQEAVDEEPKQPRRGRKTNLSRSNVVLDNRTRSKKTASVTETKADEKPVKTRAKTIETQSSTQSEPPTRARGRKLETIIKAKQAQIGGKKADNEAKPVETETKTRGKKLKPQLSVQSEPTTRARRTKVEDVVAVLPETKGRKRKAAANEEIPSKVAKTGPKRGKKGDAPVAETTGKPKSALTKENKIDNNKREVTTRGTKSKRAEKTNEPEEKKTKSVRGRQAAEPKEKLVEAGRGKRKAVVEPSPANAAAKKRATRTAAAPAPAPPAPAPAPLAPARPARSRRGNTQPEVTMKEAGRSRRR